MGVLAGIDLLAKYLAGSDTVGGVGKRYCDFINKYFQPVNADDAETLYQFRNALIHSFGLFSQSKTKAYHFGMSMNGSTLIKARSSDRYTIDVFALHERFEQSVCRFQTDLDADSTLQSHFAKMFPKYGSISYSGG
jgi:hypothetical protein